MSSNNTSTRNRILSSCQELLETRGSAGVRMSDIAKLAGISRQALYLHFPNRAELLIATTRYLDDIHDIGAAVEARVLRATGTGRLIAFIEVWGDYIPKIYGVGKALLAIKDTDAEARAAWDDRMSAVRGLCELTVSSLAENHALTADLDQKTAVDLLWTLVSVRNWEQLTQDCGWTQAQYLQHLKRAATKLIVA